jgi:hypothetical protein
VTDRVDWIAAAAAARAIAPEQVYGASPGRMPCPLHGGSNDSFGIYEAEEGGARWHCHSACGAGGDAIQFVATRHGYRPGDPYPTGELFRRVVADLLDLDGATVEGFGLAPAAKGSKRYPPLEEVHSVLEHSLDLDPDDPSPLKIGGRERPGIGSRAQLRGLGLAHPLVRLIDPSWPAEDRPEWARKWAGAVIALYDSRGSAVTVHNRRTRPGKVKGINPKGFRVGDAVAANAVAVDLLAGDRVAKECARAVGVVIVEGVPAFLAWSSWHPGPVFGLPGQVVPSSTLRRLPKDALIRLDIDPDAAGLKYLSSLLWGLADHERLQWSVRTAWGHSKAVSGGSKEAAKAALEVAQAADARLRDPDERAGREGVVDGAGWADVPAEVRAKLTEGRVSSKDAVSPGSPVRLCAYWGHAPIPPELTIPKGYELHPDGALYKPASGDDPPKFLAHEVPVVSRQLSDPDTGEERLAVVFRRRGAWRTAIVDRADVAAGGQGLARVLGRVGAPVAPTSSQATAQWLADLDRTSQSTVPHAVVTRRSGWHEVEGKGGLEWLFVLGGEAFGPGGDLSDRVVFDDAGDASGVTRHVRAAGSLGEHRQLVAELVAASPVAACAVYSALAAPLLERIGAPSYGFHLVGRSSSGKTTGLYGAGGIYGSPELRRGGWLSTWETTPVGLEQRAGMSSDLPMCVDEAGLMPADKREPAVYMLIGGQGRSRGARNGGMRATATWCTVLISTGEEELIRADRSHAGAQVRVIQARVAGLGGLDGEAVSRLKAGFTTHYGHLGRQWIAHLLCLDSAGWVRLRDRYADLAREFRASAGPSSLAARQAEAYAVMQLAEELAAEWLGLPLTGAVTHLAANAEDRVEVVPEWRRALDLLSDWRTSEPSAWPEVVLDSSGQKVVRDLDARRGERVGLRLAAYVDADEGGAERWVYLIPGPARDRLAEHGLSLDVVARSWAEGGLLERGEKGHLTRKRSLNGSRPRVYALRVEALEDDDREGCPGGCPPTNDRSGAGLTVDNQRDIAAGAPPAPPAPPLEGGHACARDVRGCAGARVRAHELHRGGAGGAGGAPLSNGQWKRGFSPAPPDGIAYLEGGAGAGQGTGWGSPTGDPTSEFSDDDIGGRRF